MPEQNIEIEINLLLPDIHSGDNECLIRLKDALLSRRGITHVHLEEESDSLQICIHYNPNLISLAAVHRTAKKAGASLSDRYQHEQIPFDGMDRADEASILRRTLERVPGMLHADVNYAAGLAFVAYDSTLLQPDRIAKTMLSMGIIPLDWPRPVEEDAHDHGSAPAFLPHWMQARWPLILVGLAGVFLLIGWAGSTFFNLDELVDMILPCMPSLA